MAKTKNQKEKCNTKAINKHIAELINIPKSYNRPIDNREECLLHIKKFKHNKKYQDIVEFYKKIPKHFKDILYSDIFPKNITNLNNRVAIHRSNNLIANLNEMLALFCIYAQKIDSFLLHKNEFEKNFLLGEYSASGSILTETVNNISYSNWFLYHSLLMKEYEVGFEGNMSLLKTFLTNGPEHPLHTIFCNCFSRLAEQDLTIDNYKTHIDIDFFRRHNIPDEKRQFFQVYIEPLSVYFFDDIAGVFALEENSSLIDKYLTFRKLLTNLMINNRALCLQLVSNAIKFTNDSQLFRIYFLLTGNLNFYEPSDEDHYLYQILDYYTEGKYYDCIQLSEKYILTNNISIDILEVYLKACINIGNKPKVLGLASSLLNKILLNMYNVLSKNNLTVEAMGNLYTIAYSLHYFDISTQLLYFIHKADNAQQNELYNKIYQICTATITPKIVYEFSNIAQRENILDKLLKVNINKQTVDFFIKLLKLEMNDSVDLSKLNIPINRLLLYTSKILFDAKDYANVIYNLEPILSDSIKISHIYEECLVRLYSAYSMKNNTHKCINLYVDNYFYNKYLINNIDTSNEINYISHFEGYKKLAIDINIMLYLHICKVSTKILSLAYRIFIRTLQLKYPNEINIAQFESDKIVYFLRYICVRDILSKDVLNYETQNDVENERLKICKLLLMLDATNSEIYNEEIIQITQNIKIKERIREIDNSKIYVDINGLINYSLKDFEKNFSRFKKINDLRKKTGDEYSLLIHTAENSILGDTAHKYKAKYLTLNDQLYDIFIELFIEIRDKYLFSNEHGLDSYLSTRIRHGTIAGQLRKTFSDFNLITTKDSATGIYINNTKWTENLNMREEDIGEFNDIMNNFSKNIDSFNSYIKNSLIHIKTEDEAEALFDFSIYNIFNNYILNHFFNNKIIHAETHEEFIATSIEILEYIIDNKLERIRDHFKSIINTKFVSLLDGLEKNITELNKKNDFSQLLSNIRHARTEIQTTIDLVSTWFERKKRRNIDFEFKDVIETSKKIIDNLSSSSITLNIQSKINFDYIFNGEYFIDFVDLFKIFFENILNHVKSKHHIQADIDVAVFEDEEYFKFTISNKLIDTNKQDLDKLSSKIDKKTLEIEESFNSNATRREDNTGILKAVKIIKISLKNRDNTLQVKLLNETFVVELKIYKKGLIGEYSNN